MKPHRRVVLLVLFCLTLWSLPMFAQTTAASEPKLDTGDTAWMLTSAALVFFMTIPGLFLFYGGLVRSNVLPFTYHRKEICRNCQAPDERQLKSILTLPAISTSRPASCMARTQP